MCIYKNNTKEIINISQKIKIKILWMANILGGLNLIGVLVQATDNEGCLPFPTIRQICYGRLS